MFSRVLAPLFENSRQQAGRRQDPETTVHSTATSTLVPVSEHTHPMCGKVESVRILNAGTYATSNNKNFLSLHYQVQEHSSWAEIFIF